MTFQTDAPPRGNPVALKMPSYLGRWSLALAIAGLLLSIILLGIVVIAIAVVLAIIGLTSSGFTRKTSVAALVISGAGIVVFVLMLIAVIHASQ